MIVECGKAAAGWCGLGVAGYIIILVSVFLGYIRLRAFGSYNNAKVLIDRVADYLPEEATELIGQAYEYADECHQGQLRKSGDPYIDHPVETALFLADLHLDTHTIIAALLHDVVEDCDVTLEEVEARFGPETAKLVDGVTKLTRMDAPLPRSVGERC